MGKLILIIDKSEAYISYKIDEILQEWGETETQKISSIQHPPSSDLFGGNPLSQLNMKTVKDTTDFLSKQEDDWLNNNYPNGLIMTTTAPRTTTRKLEKLLKQAGGVIIIPPTSKEGSLTERLLNEVNLNTEVKEYLKNYVGDDYDTLIPIIRGVKTIPSPQHKRITIEDMYSRLPTPPGAVPPWKIEEPLLQGDVTKTIDIFRRIHEHQHLLVAISILKNRFQNYYKLKLLKKQGVKEEEIATLLGVKNKGQLYYMSKNVKHLDSKKLEDIVILLERTESKVKGAGREPIIALTEQALIRICNIFKEGARE